MPWNKSKDSELKNDKCFLALGHVRDFKMLMWILKSLRKIQFSPIYYTMGFFFCCIIGQTVDPQFSCRVTATPTNPTKYTKYLLYAKAGFEIPHDLNAALMKF